MEGKHVFSDVTARLLVNIVVLTEKLFAGLSNTSLEALRKIRPHQTNGRIHRVIAGPAIDPEPLDFLLEHPFEQFDFYTGMHTKISNQVLLGLAFPIAMPAGVNDHNISVTNLDRRLLDHLRRDHGPIVHMLGDIDDSAWPNKEIEGIRRHIAHAIGAMHHAIDMGSDMEGCIYPL